MSQPLSEGMIFAGRYRVIRSIAAGAMGAVYEVIHLGTERRRALKVMHPHMFQSDEMRARFAQEARITSRIESEYIVDVADAGVDEATQTPYLVMELLQGEELGQRLKRVGRFSPGEVVTYLSQVALALDRTHRASIVHRDLKPGNLFLTEREDGTPRIKILDFGVAKMIAEGSTGGGTTQSLGTPLYMPPEQFRGGTRLTPAADIFALGMLAYTLLVGEPYWSQEADQCGDVIAFALVVMRGPAESPVARAAARGVKLPPAFNGWFAKATALEPTARFGKATEAVRALAEVFGVALGPGAPSMSSGVWAAGSGSNPDSGRGATASSASSGVDRMGGSTSAAVTLGRKDAGAGVFVAVALATALVIGGLGLGGFAWLQSKSEKPEKGVAAVQRVAAPVEAATAEARAPAAAASSASGEVATAATAAPSASASATPSVAARPAVKGATHPDAGSKRPAATAAPMGRLLGRD